MSTQVITEEARMHYHPNEYDPIYYAQYFAMKGLTDIYKNIFWGKEMAELCEEFMKIRDSRDDISKYKLLIKIFTHLENGNYNKEMRSILAPLQIDLFKIRSKIYIYRINRIYKNV